MNTNIKKCDSFWGYSRVYNSNFEIENEGPSKKRENAIFYEIRNKSFCYYQAVQIIRSKGAKTADINCTVFILETSNQM